MQLDGKGERSAMGVPAASTAVFSGLQAAVPSTWLQPKNPDSQEARVLSALERNGIDRICTHSQGLLPLQDGRLGGETMFFVIEDSADLNNDEQLSRFGGKWVVTVPLVMACVANRFPPPRPLLDGGCGLDPSTAVVPMKSTCMKQLTICATQFPSAVKKDLAKKVLACGGGFQLGFNPHPKILIALTSNSDKYRAAVKFKIPVLTSAFVDECWNRGKLQPQHKYVFPPFQGLTICVSGKDLVGSKRSEISKLTTKNGGTYNKDLDSNVTHLVCNCSAKQGEKYKLAVKLKIKIVNPKWIYSSDERQARLDEAAFAVRDGPQASNPSPRPTPPPSTVTNFPATTATTTTKGEQLFSRLNISSYSKKVSPAIESGRGRAYMDKENSALRTIEQKSTSPRLPSGIPNEGDVDVVTSKLNGNTSIKSLTAEVAQEPNEEFESAYIPSESSIKQREVDAANSFSGSDCLRGLVILIAGFSSANKPKIMRIINLLGGFCVDDKSVGLFMSKAKDPVGLERTTTTTGSRIDANSSHRRFESNSGIGSSDDVRISAMMLSQLCPVIVLGNKGLKQSFAYDVLVASIRAGYMQATTAKWLQHCFDESELFPLCNYTLTSKQLGSILSGQALAKTAESDEPEHCRIVQNSDSAERDTREENWDSSLDRWTVICSWRNKVVACHEDLPAHDLSEIKFMFEDTDAILDGQAGDSVDYLVCPDSLPEDTIPPKNKRDFDVVSLEWVIATLRVKELIDPGRSPLYRPLWHNVCRVLDSDVICPTEYESSDRVEIELAAAKLGATYDENLSKQTTHLISPSFEKSNPKIAKAREWGIHIVTIEWIRDALRNNARGSEEAFSFEDPESRPAQRGIKNTDTRSSQALPGPSVRSPRARKGVRQSKGIQNKRGGYRGLKLEKCSQGIDSQPRAAKRGRTNTKPVSPMDRAGDKTKTGAQNEKNGVKSIRSKYSTQSAPRNEFSSWDTMFDLYEPMTRMSAGHQGGSGSANASSKAEQPASMSAASMKEKGAVISSDSRQVAAATGDGVALQVDTEKSNGNGASTAAVNSSQANPTPFAIEDLSQLKVKPPHEDDQSKSPSKRSVLGKLRMKSRARMATQLEREAMNLEEDTKTQGPSLSLNLTTNTASPEENDKRTRRTRTSTRLRQKRASKTSPAQSVQDSGENTQTSKDTLHGSVSRGDPPLSIQQACGILRHQSDWFPESTAHEFSTAAHLASDDVIKNTQEMAVEIGWGDGNTNVEALEETPVFDSNGDDGQDGAIDERPSKSRRGLANRLEQLKELTTKRNLQH